ncbi:LCR [Medicago truncatula]|uniref:LCR n=1 Tax=Medicago truncatula TaxID=3880 RepID=A0A072U0K4_MEDTR|nr:LCR [Medicago truncatula]
MASHVYQSSLQWILCFLFVFALLSGFATSSRGGTPGLSCRRKCINNQECNQYCNKHGFGRGGYCYCMGTTLGAAECPVPGQVKLCCCH